MRADVANVADAVYTPTRISLGYISGIFPEKFRKYSDILFFRKTYNTSNSSNSGKAKTQELPAILPQYLNPECIR